MKFSEEIMNDVVVLRMDGQIMGGPESKQFQERLYQGIEQDSVNFVIDMSKASWMNSSGLGVLISGLATLRSSSGDLRLANVSERLRRPFEITKLDSVFQIFDSVSSAVNSFK